MKNLRRKDCCLCELSKTCSVKCIIGRGTSKSGIMLIGEAPVFTDDIAEMPLMGRAGKVLSRALQQAGINEQDAYITYAVKCAPPDRGTPSESQSFKCRRYLFQEIEIVRPKAIVCLGAVAYRSFFPSHTKDIRDSHIQPFMNIPVYPTYNPAAVIRNCILNQILIDDLKRVVREIARKEVYASKATVSI